MAYNTNSKVRRSNAGPGAMHSLRSASTLASSTGTHYEFDLGGSYAKFGLQVTAATTTVNKVNLEGSIGGSTFFTIAGSTWIGGTNENGDIIWVTGFPCTKIRATVAAVVASSSDPAITAYISAGG